MEHITPLHASCGLTATPARFLGEPLTDFRVNTRVRVSAAGPPTLSTRWADPWERQQGESMTAHLAFRPPGGGLDLAPDRCPRWVCPFDPVACSAVRDAGVRAGRPCGPGDRAIDPGRQSPHRHDVAGPGCVSRHGHPPVVRQVGLHRARRRAQGLPLLSGARCLPQTPRPTVKTCARCARPVRRRPGEPPTRWPLGDPPCAGPLVRRAAHGGVWHRARRDRCRDRRSGLRRRPGGTARTW